MAIINSYPKKTTPADGDLFVITDSEQTAPNKNRTKTLSVGDLTSYIQEDAVIKLIPYVTTASPGGSETYTALNNIVKIGWSGGNGIYVINLPSAATIPYRNIRFTTNGTYPGGGAHKVRFTATGGETIDGTTYYEVAKAYEGISIWSTGTEWIVIQAKAS